MHFFFAYYLFIIFSNKRGETMNNLIMSAKDLENCLTSEDNDFLLKLEKLYSKLNEPSAQFEASSSK